jgi:hypothetical protein
MRVEAATALTRHPRRLAATALLAAGALALLPSTAAARPAARTLSWQAPAAGLAAVHLDAGNGIVEVTATGGDEVRVSVVTRLRRWSDDEPWRRIAGWFLTSAYDEDEALMAGLELVHRRTAGALELGLDPGGRVRTNRIEEVWRVEVPAGQRVAVRLDGGDVTVRGVAGGVRVRLGAGDLRVAVPEGDLDLAVAVGDIEASLAAASTRRVELSADVGDTTLWVAGNRIEHPREPGPGNRTSLRGRGRFTVEARVDVGEVTVRVGDN